VNGRDYGSQRLRKDKAFELLHRWT
jgi:hypothetical protein